MKRIAIIYHSVEGQAEKIAHQIARTAADEGVCADTFPVASAPASLWTYDAIIAGGSVHLGRHHKDLLAYIRNHLPQLRARHTAFFSVSMTAANSDDESQALIQEIVDAFLDEAGWQPDAVAIFAGALPYSKLGFLKRHLVKQFARRMGQPTDTSHDYEFTDWDAVSRFAVDVVAELRPAAAS
ncbi:MAG: hypothetical protein Kow0010_00150 [Dehalococcoidia bacterium]